LAQIGEQKRLFLLNLMRSSTVPQASHLAISPLGDIPIPLLEGEEARFLPAEQRGEFVSIIEK
jgi:hypothetical protein